ncbi:PspC domain-containing protein [Paenibacillus ginsengarvi]|uniref:PspC domain-containing protein n=1 Tax=Paenibacillus ginsengarvi TaxID=400777 RepID=A0A3B0B006_9BACL|nr:PspC domain-containing protein [Paenibacillus ginsengarvi]RKN65487.1 PspC domain-containing protein [Paenibacillus ginsengarvi]
MKKLYRSQRDKKLFGICGGLADMLQVDSTLLRLIIVVTTFFTGGILIPIYILAALVIPKEPGIESPLASSWNQYGSGHQAYSTPQGGYGYQHSHTPHYSAAAAKPAAQPEEQLDHMMKDIESKAMWNEIQELKAKLSKYEKGDV